MVGFQRLASLCDALKALKEEMTHRITRYSEAPLEEALGLIAAEDVLAPVDLPSCDRSAVDGYAVIAGDTEGAGLSPVKLRLKGSIEPGKEIPEGAELRSGEAYRIMTGCCMPKGSTAVVMAEDASISGDYVEVRRKVLENQNVILKGEDFKRGDLVVRRGTRIKPWHIAALAALGISKIKVLDKPRIAVLSTGDELVELGVEPKGGQVINSSKPMLKALLRESGANPIDLGTTPDRFEDIRSRVISGLSHFDGVIITGGTSIGTKDIVPEVVDSIGRPGVLVHGLRVKPAKATGLGVVSGRPIFMLSGYPASAIIGFYLLVRPALRLMMGSSEIGERAVRAKLSKTLTKPAGTTYVYRVIVRRSSGEYVADPIPKLGAGQVSTFLRSNGLLTVPEGVERLEEGDYVDVELIDSVAE